MAEAHLFIFNCRRQYNTVCGAGAFPPRRSSWKRRQMRGCFFRKAGNKSRRRTLRREKNQNEQKWSRERAQPARAVAEGCMRNYFGIRQAGRTNTESLGRQENTNHQRKYIMIKWDVVQSTQHTFLPRRIAPSRLPLEGFSHPEQSQSKMGAFARNEIRRNKVSNFVTWYDISARGNLRNMNKLNFLGSVLFPWK